jgi:hypothetical protein
MLSGVIQKLPGQKEGVGGREGGQYKHSLESPRGSHGKG